MFNSRNTNDIDYRKVPTLYEIGEVVAFRPPNRSDTMLGRITDKKHFTSGWRYTLRTEGYKDAKLIPEKWIVPKDMKNAGLTKFLSKDY